MRPWLRELRKEKGMSRKEAAKAAGMSVSYLDSIENGSRNASVPAAKKLAAVLGFSWTKFFE